MKFKKKAKNIRLGSLNQVSEPRHVQFICVYIKAVVNSVMLQLYLGHDFFVKQFLKSKVNYIQPEGGPPPPHSFNKKFCVRA